MEPVTHVLTGACLARAGLNRRAAYATAAMAIAAEFPDIDTLWGLRGPVSGFEHHRGITHTFLGVPFEAALILLGFVAYHRLRHRHEDPAEAISPSRQSSSAAPVSWGVLYLLLLLALVSHLWLDYTNNYGLRPFFPFDGRWFSGSFVFIFDPVLFLFLLIGLVAPAFFGLIGREVGARPERFRGRGWARAALCGALLLWSVRWMEHSKAVRMAQAQTMLSPGDVGPPSTPPVQEAPNSESPEPGGTQPASEDRRTLLSPERSLANPDPLSIFRWYTVSDYGPAYRLGVADLRAGAFSAGEILDKPLGSPVVQQAASSDLGRFYFSWSPMPALTVSRGMPGGFESEGDVTNSGVQTVTFRDPRFMGDTQWLRGSDGTPLTGEVVVNAHGDVIGQGMDGRFGR